MVVKLIIRNTRDDGMTHFVGRMGRKQSPSGWLCHFKGRLRKKRIKHCEVLPKIKNCGDLLVG
jgi:hypothetical protein